MRTIPMAFAILAALAESVPVRAEPPGRAADGAALAERWCAACHAVDGVRTSDTAPPFRALADRPDLDALAVAEFLQAPHPPMPDLSLSRREAADLAAYIRGLGRD